MITMDLAKTLSYNYVFRGLPKGTVAFLAALAEVRTFSGGDILVRQYDRSDDMIVILDGEAVTKTIHGEILASFGAGSVLGEVALLDGQARSATVTAVRNCTVAVIRGEDIRSMMDADPYVARTILGNLARVLCRRLRTMNAQAESGHAAAALR